MHDAIIIGGGPAGATAAIALARLGRRVMVVEQRRFPRDKVCGECLSAFGVDALEQLGIKSAIAGLGPAVLRRVAIHSATGASVALDLLRPMWGISRRRFDAALLDLAREAGAEICQPSRCEGIAAGPETWARIRDLSDNRLQRLPARWLVIADGKAGLLWPRRAPSGALGLKACFDGIDQAADVIELFGVRGHYGGLAPIEGGRWNAAFSVPSRRIARYRGDLDAVMRDVIGENRVLSRRMASGRRIGPWIASPLPRFAVAGAWPAGIIPVGNAAAAAIEPIGGEGMGLALHSGLLAARFIHESPSAAVDAGVLRQAFSRLCRTRRMACRALAIMVSFPPAARAMVALASLGLALPVAALRLMGKSDRAPVAGHGS